jgi:uncharacterized RDD family membrane protein YckC
MNKYKTFSRRFWAAIVDMGVFVPLGWIDTAIWENVKVPVILSVWIVIHTAAFWIYGILLHGYYGQTVGKFVCHVKVLDKTEKPLSVKQAFYRDAFPIVMGMPVLVYEVNNVLQGHIANRGFPTEMNIIFQAFLGISFLWFLLELITMLTNKKRRAIHDFIAGSVVVRLESDGSPEEQKKARYRKLMFFGLMVLLIFDMIWTISKEHLTR